MYGKRSEIQLCYPLEQRRLEDPKFGWSYPVLTQPKLDGERCRALEEIHGTVNLISSELNDFMGVPHVNQALENIKKEFPELPELDGELYCHGMTMPEIHSIVSRSLDNLHPDFQQMQYHIFDIVTDQPQIKRLVDLNENIHPFLSSCSSIEVVPTKTAQNFKEILDQYQEYIEQGYEGIIVRHVTAPYVRKRSRFILKFKPKKQDAYPIIGINEAMDKNGLSKNMVGAFICRGSDGTEFPIGAGTLDHKKRREHWIFKRHIIGKKHCLVEYQNINTNSGRPRFGICIDVIDDPSTFND